MNKNIYDISKILEHLVTKYGIDALDVSPAERGFVAETYTAKTQEKDFFVKMVKKGRYDEGIEESARAQYQFIQEGITQIPKIILSKENEPITVLDDYSFILYEKIDGSWAREFNELEIVRILSRVHNLKPKDYNYLPQESFNPHFMKPLKNLLSEIHDARDANLGHRSLKSFLHKHRDDITFHTGNFLSLCKQCRNEDFSIKITHGDPWGNVAKDSKEELVLFDWDNILLAPAERDLWFKISDESAISGYKSLNPAYKVNKMAYDFYLYTRFFYDLYGFLVEIVGEGTSEHKEQNFYLLEKDWRDWLLSEVGEKITTVY